MKVDAKKTGLFLALTFGVSWLMAGLFFALGGEWNTPPAIALGVAYMFVPMIMAIVVQKLVYGEPWRGPLGVSFRPRPRWLVAAWLLPAAVALAAVGVGLLMPGAEYSPGMEGMYRRFESMMTPEQLDRMRAFAERMPVHVFWLALVQGLLAGITVNALAAFGEELGWRGFMQRELGALGFWRSSCLTGFVWGVWHAPLILQGHNYPEHPVAGVAMMVAFCMLYAPLLSYVRLRAKSVVAAAVMHGTLNGTAGLAIMVLKGGSDLTVGVTGLAGFTVLALANVTICLHDRFVSREPIMTATSET